MKQLPAAAIARDPAQPTWPVHADHCFGRIILDVAVGVDRPWREKLAAPAIRHMNTQQFESCVNLAKEISGGKADLVALNRQSLQLRGKDKKGKLEDSPTDTATVKAGVLSIRSSTRKRYTQTTLRSFSVSAMTGAGERIRRELANGDKSKSR